MAEPARPDRSASAHEEASRRARSYGTSARTGGDPGEVEAAEAADRTAARLRAQHQASWVDQQIRVAMARGDFDDLPGAGKPLDLGDAHDPYWWVRRLVERERITGVLPAALQLRKDDAELDARLDRLSDEPEVRREVEEFNARVIRARYTPVDGPPLITMPREVEETVAAWRERREERRRAVLAAPPPPPPEPTGRLARLRRRLRRRG